MSTTSVFIELLIAGIQASVWVALLIVGLAGYTWLLSVVQELKKWVGPVTVVLFALWYTLGIMVDQLAIAWFALLGSEKFLQGLAKILQRLLQGKKIKRELKQSIMLRARVLARADEAVVFLKYIRSRMRIMRATVFNATMTTVSATVLLLVRGRALTARSLWVVLVIGVVVNLLALFVWAGLMIGYDAYIQEIDKELEETTKAN
jgi:hypothetical protein